MHTKENLANIENKNGCTIGVCACDFDANFVFFEHVSREQKIAASSIKLFFAGAVMNALRTKNLSLETGVPVNPSHFVCGISILADLTTDTMSIRDLLYLLLAHSDTSAQNTLEQVVTEKEVNDYIQKTGFKETRFVSKNFSTETHLSCTTPFDVVNFLQKLWNKEIGKPNDSNLLLSFLAQSRITHFGLRYLPTRLITNKPIITERYSKAGKIYHSINDSLILKTEKGTLGLSIFIDNFSAKDKFNSVDYDGVLLLAKISETIFADWHISKTQ